MCFNLIADCTFQDKKWQHMTGTNETAFTLCYAVKDRMFGRDDRSRDLSLSGINKAQRRDFLDKRRAVQINNAEAGTDMPQNLT
jgi:hypothetical protein